jgi:hypothetical protein
MREGYGLENRLLGAGLFLRDARLTLAVPEPEELQYTVRYDVALVSDEHGVSWLAFNWRSQARLSPPPGECLAQFVRLGKAQDSKVLAFAAAWGPFSSEGPLLKQGKRTRVDDWRLVASQTAALLGVASNLQKGNRPESDEWDMMVSAYPPLDEIALRLAAPSRNAWSVHRDRMDRLARAEEDDEDPPMPPSPPVVTATSPIDWQKYIVAFLVDRWFEYGNVKVRSRWGGEFGSDIETFAATVLPDPRPLLTSADPLAGLLAIELAAALGSPRGIYRCDDCGYPYTPPKRRPRTGVARYCPTCSEGASVAAKRSWWRAKKSGGRGGCAQVGHPI